MSVHAPSPVRRVRVRVTGTVQGVGFRPYVYRLAGELGLAGFVLNDSRGVLVEVEGPEPALTRFLERLGPGAPPLALLEEIRTAEVPTTRESEFRIAQSPHGQVADAPVAADSTTCADCLSELLDPGDRRYRYPFTNCTNCGPRFTIVQGVPYDRPLTTMAGFSMCARCRAEYEDPADRRFHAQPNACPECGPSAWLADAEGQRPGTAGAQDAIEAAARALDDGLILAIKGLGGFHLACRADDEPAVARLRTKKHREDKPFALMAASPEQALGLVELGDVGLKLLCSAQRPIVLGPRRAQPGVAASVAPGAPELGVMLPYTPLHHLLLGDAGGPLVMTSGNVSDEPIAYRDEDALERLANIAEGFLLHDRPIHTRTDDSVARVVEHGSERRPMLLRRSRGYVPGAVSLPGATTPMLACGAELKNTFCVAKGGRAWVSHHIGDLKNFETLQSFTEGIEHFKRLFAVTPALVAHDLHPEYLSTKYATELEDVRLLGVQHHHAHLAACLAEHSEAGPAVGAIFDGTGYGTDGAVWGGELLFGDTAEFHRTGHLLPVRLPGGERAVREPWRMACSWLLACAEDLADGEELALPDALAGQVDPRSWRAVAQMASRGVSSPETTSMGRLFDAVAALCGVRAAVNYEGQAAIELEAVCDPAERSAYPVAVQARDDRLLIDPREAVRAVCAEVAGGTSRALIAARFHNAIAEATVSGCAMAASAQGADLVVLSGGVFQNRRLLKAASAGLRACGLRVLIPQMLPPGDGGISYGQAAVAARRLAEGAMGGPRA